MLSEILCSVKSLREVREMVGHWQIGKWRESSLKYLRKMKSFCLFISVVRKWDFWHILKSTLILKVTHEFNLEIKVDLKSTLISKKQFLHTLKSTLISRQLKFFHRWIISHPLYNAHSWVLKRVWISSSWMIFLNIIILIDPLVTPSALLKGCWLFVWRFHACGFLPYVLLRLSCDGISINIVSCCALICCVIVNEKSMTVRV